MTKHNDKSTILYNMEDIYRLQKEKEWLSRRPAHRTTIIKEDSVKKVEIWIDNK